MNLKIPQPFPQPFPFSATVPILYDSSSKKRIFVRKLIKHKNDMMKYATILDIARELGISKSTVSRALRGDSQNVSKETRTKILEMADKLGYKRNELAVNLRQQSTRTIGIIVPEMITSFYVNFITFAQQHLNKAGYRVMLAQSHENPDVEKMNLKMMEDYRVDGILISVCHDHINLSEYQRIMDKGTPMVFFDRTVAELKTSQIKINDYIKSFFMVEHLIRQGRKRIVHLAGPPYIQNTFDRIRGYKDALDKFGIPFDKKFLVEGGIDFDSGYGAAKTLWEHGVTFDAIFSFTEMSALGAKNYLQSKQIRIPEEVAVSCMSGTDLCKLVHPTITAVEQPVEQMAETASRIIIEKLENPSLPHSTVVLDAEAVYRESTRNRSE